MLTEIKLEKKTLLSINNLKNCISSTCNKMLRALMEGVGWVCMSKRHHQLPIDLMPLVKVIKRSQMGLICLISLSPRANLTRKTYSSLKSVTKRNRKERRKNRHQRKQDLKSKNSRIFKSLRCQWLTRVNAKFLLMSETTTTTI